MPVRSTLLVLSATALVVAAFLAVGPTLGAAPQPAGARKIIPLEDFARPAAVGSRQSAVDADPVWRLGRRLFFDPRLSRSATMSCASCHKPDQSWTDHEPRGVGDTKQRLAFRVPTLLNAGHIERYGWSGRFDDVQTVALFAMSSPTNMNASPEQTAGRLRSEPSYAADFRAAFPNGAISKDNVGAALGRYVRSIASAEAPFDRWVSGQTNAIGASAVRGFELFRGKAKCAECHKGWAFTDGSFHDIGLAREEDIGRGKRFPSSIKLQHAFKTPTLRNVAVRAPYMHDGSVASLEKVVDLYAKGGIDRPSRAEAVRSIRLTAQDKKDLVAFLETLTSDTQFVTMTDD